MKFPCTQIYTKDVVCSGLFVVWGVCIMEMVGVMSSNIHDRLGDLLIVCSGLYYIGIDYFVPKTTETKTKAMNDILVAFSNEIKKVVDASSIQSLHDVDVGWDIDDESVKEECDMYSHDYIKSQVEMIEKAIEHTDEIQKNLNVITTKMACGGEPHEYQCMKCDADLNTVSQCSEGDHWFKCAKCETIETPSGTVTVDYTNEYILGPQPLYDRGRSLSLDNIYNPRYGSRSRSRSRSRDREGDDDCDHHMVRHVAGYDDIYNRCQKCGYESCK
jgi:hypothetical protein